MWRETRLYGVRAMRSYGVDVVAVYWLWFGETLGLTYKWSILAL